MLALWAFGIFGSGDQLCMEFAHFERFALLGTNDTLKECQMITVHAYT